MFEKNLEFLEEEETERIRGVRAAVIGLGALGQMAAHELVRGGMERLTLVDGDVMEQSNLNRQLYADILTLHHPKAEILLERLGDISPRLKIKSYPVFLDRMNAGDILRDADMILDCVDNIHAKLYLEEAAEALGIPLIHGAVEGWCGQAAVIYPGDRLLSLIYERQKEQKRAALMPAVGVIASVQACEALKIAAGKKCALQGKLFCADLLNSEFECIPFS